MQRIVVTGATGFIGSHSIATLCSKGFDVVAVSRVSRTSQYGESWVQHDLLNLDACSKLIDEVRPAYLLHFAWETTPGTYTADPLNQEWLDASRTLLDSFIVSGGQRVVMAGSCMEYDWADGVCIEDETPLHPETFYGACKAELSRSIVQRLATSDATGAWGRIFFCFGPGEPSGRLVPYVIQSLLRGERAICSKGLHKRDFMDSREIASAFVALLESDVAGPVNIGTGCAIRIRDFVMKIAEKLGRPDLVEFGGGKGSTSEVPLVEADITRLSEEVGWSPASDLDERLDQVIDWWSDALAVRRS